MLGSVFTLTDGSVQVMAMSLTKTFSIPGGLNLMTLVNHQLFFNRHHKVDIFCSDYYCHEIS